MKPKFKVGDRVKYVEHYETAPMDQDYFIIGKIYQITEIIGEAIYLNIIERREVFASQITLPLIPNTKLGRKLYPDHIIIDKDWIEI